MTDHEITVQLDLTIPMRDDVQLYGVLYRPSTGNRFPTLLIRSIYGTQFPRYVEWAERFAKHGYAVVMQDSRGRYESDGKFDPYVCEINDGYDTQTWVSKQSWCDGNIGLFGVSYPGFQQILPAPFRCPAVKAMVPIAHQEDNYGHHRWDGVLQIQNAMHWLWIGDRITQDAHEVHFRWDDLFSRLPLISALDDVGNRPFYRDVVRHYRFDDFWKAATMKGKYSEVETPAYFITGWYDNLVREVIKVFTHWKAEARTSEARDKTRLLVGPWPHMPMGTGEPFGDITFGGDAGANMPDVHLPWFDQRLRGINTGIDDQPPVRLFVMGENVWRDENEWPLARTEFTNYFLHSDGHANTVDGDGTLDLKIRSKESPDSFVYDPLNPVPTVGGQSLLNETLGPRDRQSVEKRSDVLVYSTPTLEADLEITGPIELILYAASSATDTDFTATLIDVHPNGKAIIICEGIVRARFRDSYEEPALIEPGRIYKYSIVLSETSNLFKAGHCLRLEVSSSNFPRFERNQNTGTQPGLDDVIEIAHQTIYHSTVHPSHIALPVIPR